MVEGESETATIHSYDNTSRSQSASLDTHLQDAEQKTLVRTLFSARGKPRGDLTFCQHPLASLAVSCRSTKHKTFPKSQFNTEPTRKTLLWYYRLVVLAMCVDWHLWCVKPTFSRCAMMAFQSNRVLYLLQDQKSNFHGCQRYKYGFFF